MEIILDAREIPEDMAHLFEPVPDSAGKMRNMVDTWAIGTQAYSAAHFATFPEALVEPCILAGTSAKGVCPACGAPWARVVETTGGSKGHSWHDHKADHTLGQRATDPASKGGHGYGTATLGWRPTCECYRPECEARYPRSRRWKRRAGQDFTGSWYGRTMTRYAHEFDATAATVLDPFMGSGTTGVVALRHNRNFVGIELKPDYVELARKRLAEVQPNLPGVCPEK